jgi:putative inorganic carbon (HCO3(-)) transporter
LVTAPRQKKVLATTDHHSPVVVRRVARLRPEFSLGAIHLHDLLGSVWTSSEGIDNMKSDRRSFDYEPVTRPRAVRKNEITGALSEPIKPNLPITDRVTIKEALPRQEGSKSNHSKLQSEQPTREVKGADQIWTSRRGHALSFAALFLYTALAYFRPYELSPSLAWTAWLPYSLAIVMLAIFIPTQLGLEGRFTTRPREVNLLLLFGLIALISIPQAISPLLAWNTFYSLFFKTAIMFVVMVNVLRSELRLKAMILLGIMVGCFMSASALQNYVFGSLVNEGTRAKVGINNMFGEPNALALHLVTVIPLAVVLLLSSRNIFKKAIYAAASLLMLAGLFATFSRGGFLGLVAAAVVLLWKLGRRNRMAVVAVLVLAIVAALFLAPGGYEFRLASIFDSSKDLVGSSSARKEVLLRSISVVLRRPLLGVGIGNFPIVSIRGQVSHNSYTQVASEMGLAALALFVMFILEPYRRLKRLQEESAAEKRHSRFYYLSIGLQASIVGCMVGTFFLSVAYEGYIYSLVGYAICLRGLYSLQPDVTETSSWRIGSPQPSLSPTAHPAS